ncbi:hypothetical protein PsYK624_125340 [Phanerochaete sordida]|uniref:Uncharacterized protein n=1 Tax=Phanerochaete sordida TaxID=48140 RepID=A0A9P3LIG5_9APHY|nr:hypothetical protein PsYK624_125340 [Phanerochaete sordida]
MQGRSDHGLSTAALGCFWTEQRRAAGLVLLRARAHKTSAHGSASPSRARDLRPPLSLMPIGLGLELAIR